MQTLREATPGGSFEVESVLRLLGLEVPLDSSARGRVEERVTALLDLVRLVVLAESVQGRL